MDSGLQIWDISCALSWNDDLISQLPIIALQTSADIPFLVGLLSVFAIDL